MLVYQRVLTVRNPILDGRMTGRIHKPYMFSHNICCLLVWVTTTQTQHIAASLGTGSTGTVWLKMI